MHFTAMLTSALCLALVQGIASCPTNLTAYLLSTYADEYKDAVTAPVFFQRVLNGTVDPGQVAYFFEQDTIYGRGFTTLTGQTLGLLSADLTAPTSNRTLTAIDNMGQTASGLSDEDGLLSRLREELDPGSSQQPLSPSEGTLEYVNLMKRVASTGDGFAAFVCSWTMGQAFVEVWQGIEKNQVNKPNKLPQLQQIIEYWADPSYAASIYATRDLVNSWYLEDPAAILSVAEQVFTETLDSEDAFWKSVDAWTASTGSS